MNLTDIQALLGRTPAVLEAEFAGLPESWTGRDAGPATWSARDVVAHLVQGEVEDWIPRARIVLEHGVSRTFAPFDPEGFRESEAGLTLEDLLPRFAQLRLQNLDWLARETLTEQQLDLCGTHPAFGDVTLRQLLWTWAAHDLSHLAQLARVLAHPVGDGVGPWREYLPIVRS